MLSHATRIIVPALLWIPFSITMASAQSCPAPGDNFWKNDNLPQIPTGLTAVSVIPGICEGEAIASVYTLPPGTPPQRLKQVSVGFGNEFGTNGFSAVLNIEIYDGITWVGNTPVLGPKVFDLAGTASSSFAATTHSINSFDMSPYNVMVGNGTNAFVVAFRMSINMNGSCPTGFGAANFFTDNGVFGACNATPKANLLFVLGQGWVDPSVATVSGFPLCPIFYNGNWVVRTCSEDAAGVTCQTDLGLGGPGNATLSICGGNLSTGTTATFTLANATPNSTAILFGSLAFTPTFIPQLFGVLCPLPPAFTVTLPTGPTGTLTLPNVPGGGGPGSVFVQAVIPDPAQIQGYEVTNCLRVDILP